MCIRDRFYTPLPVVRFIIRGIDDILKKEFSIVNGITDTAKISRTIEGTDARGKRVVETRDVHRVQLLDIAVGTGTFLNETISHIYESQKGNHGRWGAYVESELLPRLHGFELMMASYTVAHLKLGMTLSRQGVTGFTHRLGVYLTNTLDASHDVALQSSLFGVAQSIAEESNLASRVKKESPIMVVMGNPPYSGESMNPHYTEHDVYKVEIGGKERLKEKNSKYINDDYVKFIRFAESMIEKNGEGIIGMITAHGYIDNPTFRGMRWHLRNTFDTIYVLDLHGNSNKKESTPDGGKDENVFDIKTGVSIIFGVKKRHEANEEKPLATLYQADFYGVRSEKCASLNKENIESINWNKLPDEADVWKIEGRGKEEYRKGFRINEIFVSTSIGMQSHRDSLVIDFHKEELIKKFEEIFSTEIKLSVPRFNIVESPTWNLKNAVEKEADVEYSKFKNVEYRPFDSRAIYYSDAFIDRTRRRLAEKIDNNNPGIIFTRIVKIDYAHIFVTPYIPTAITLDINGSYFAPLYLYENGKKIPNLNREVVKEMENIVGTTAPEDILDYVYAVLHSPTYRAKYGEFLKSDFPRVPYPKDKDTFWKLVPFGTKLRNLHLLTDPEVENRITSFPVTGSNVVEKPIFKNGKVFVNEAQYWDGVSEAVWNFYIGGYQPAQKYLKDRKDRELAHAEFENYEKMIVSLSRTIEIMRQIDQHFKEV